MEISNMIHFTLPRVPPGLSKLRSANLQLRLFEAVRYECLIMNALRLCLWLDSTEDECLFH